MVLVINPKYGMGVPSKYFLKLKKPLKPKNYYFSVIQKKMKMDWIFENAQRVNIKTYNVIITTHYTISINHYCRYCCFFSQKLRFTVADDYT